VETGKLKSKKTDMLRSIGKQSGESMESVLSQVSRQCKRPGNVKVLRISKLCLIFDTEVDQLVIYTAQ